MAVSKYHPSANARTFNGGSGGWRGSEDYGGLCIQGLNCPQVTNSWQSRGFLQTKVTSLLGVAAESRGIWESPAFRYQGAQGRWPDKLRFKVHQRSHIATLASVTGNSADYSAQIVDQRGGNVIAATPIDHAELRERPGWTSVNVPVHPGLLVMGHSYTIRLTTEFITGVQVFPAASVDYDDALLRAVQKSGKAVEGDAHLRHNRLTIEVGCPRRYARCRITATGFARKKGPRVTRPAHTSVCGGHHKRLRLRVRPRYLEWVKTHKRILILQKRTANHQTQVRYRRMRIVQR